MVTNAAGDREFDLKPITNRPMSWFPPPDRWLFWIVALTILGAATAGEAQTPSPQQRRDIYSHAEPCVVQLNVTGTKDGQDVRPQSGTGFIFQTIADSRVLTARHVVGLDKEFDLAAGSITLYRRDILLRVRTDYGTVSIGPYHASKASPELDVAQVFVERAPKDCLLLSRNLPQLGDELTVMAWSIGQDRPVPTPVKVLPPVADDGGLIRLDHEFHESESGSPVLDQTGAVVAVLLLRDRKPTADPYSVALPVAAFQSWIPDAVFPKAACRDKSHGIESYGRVFTVDQTSPWMGGGFDPGRWCAQVIGVLRGQYPDGDFKELSRSEQSHTTCAPFNCPQYQYRCSVQVSADPVYVSKVSDACH